MIETFLVLAVAAIALMPAIALLGNRDFDRGTLVQVTVVGSFAISSLILFAVVLPPKNTPASDPLESLRPRVDATGEYAGSESCRVCHPSQFESWHDSYHRKMTQPANASSVIGDFDDVHLKGIDLDVRLFRKEGKYFAQLAFQNPPGGGTYPVVMTTGSHHRQAYWLARPGGEQLMMLPYMYVRAESRWIPRHSGYVNPMCLQARPEIGVFERDFNRWTAVCMNCHATHGIARPEGDAAAARRGTVAEAQVVEYGISCEACHGPGAEHVRANGNPGRRYALHLGGDTDPTIVNPAKLPHDRSSEICGQCHAVTMNRDDDAQRRWVHGGHTFRPGRVLADDSIRAVIRGPKHKNPPERLADWQAAMDDGSFWADGMYRASGREYSGLVESPCFERGEMSCGSCHRMHQERTDTRPRSEWADDQLGAGMTGNAACVQCHERFRDAATVARHTHHSAESSGNQCYNCHMPFTTYGITKAIRSHQVSSPSVRASLETGRPNACNQCHLDRPLDWTASSLKSWYAIESPPLAEEDRRVAASVKGLLSGDAGQRAIWAWSYGWKDAQQASGREWQAPFLAQLLDDRYDAVRLVAYRSLKTLEPFRDFAFDFVGPASTRSEASRRARQLWVERPNPSAAYRAFVPIDAAGTLNEPEFRRLWDRRDDRPMSINE